MGMEEWLQKKLKTNFAVKDQRKVKALVNSHIVLKLEGLPLKATADE